MIPTAMYSRIAHQLDIERAPACLLLMSDVKSVTKFGFLIKNYAEHDFLDFCITSKRARLTSFRIMFVLFVFLLVFFVTVLALELNIIFY